MTKVLQIVLAFAFALAKYLIKCEFSKGEDVVEITEGLDDAKEKVSKAIKARKDATIAFNKSDGVSNKKDKYRRD